MKGGTTRVQLHAIAGLASGHTAPFVRLLHEDVVGRRHRANDDRKSTFVAVEVPENQVLPTERQRSHHRQSEYVARWVEHNTNEEVTACAVVFPLEVDWLEVQVWNRFADVALFLGSTRISLRTMRRRANPNSGNNTESESMTGASQERPTWHPLDQGASVGLGLSNLSVQLTISWHPFDAQTERIQKKIADKRGGGGHLERKASPPAVADPSFQFVQPSHRIEWSPIVSASVRRIFLQGDVNELQLFYNDVLHGDMDQEIEDEDDIVVEEGRLHAFQLCQLSAQYLDHCVRLLDTRNEDYGDYVRTLTAAKRERRQERKALLDQKRRLQKEATDLDLLLATYQKLLKHHEQTLPVSPQQSELPMPTSALSKFPGSRSEITQHDSGDVVSKKPAFLMTWEEREQARREQKELDKARRIEDEKLRLQRRFQERKEREAVETGLTSLAQWRRQRSARIIQRAVRLFVNRRRVERASRMNAAAQRIQAHVRRFFCVKKWPLTRESLQRARDIRLMAVYDQEGVELRRRELEKWRELQARQFLDRDLLSDEDESIGSPSAKTNPVQPGELVAMWKKLKRIFSLACQKGASAHAVFKKLDSRGDHVVDRAEFRVGVRHFGIRINRKMARAIIALARAKCEDHPRPLTLSEAQFIRGFDLPAREAATVSQSLTPPTGYVAENDAIIPRHEHARKSLSSSSSEDDDHLTDRRTTQMIEDVAMAVSSLRSRVLSAAREHLGAKKQSTADYFAFREALTHVFEEFDIDGNGELDLHELVDCMAAINFRVTSDNLAIVRECFVADPASDSVSISEFISFALAGMQPPSSAKAADEELGILGYRLREAVLGKVKAARKQTESIEDAVWLVFKGAYRSKTQLSCTRREFARVLASLRLGFTPAQLSRLVLRLDQDSDETVSFDELLTWLRLRINENSPVRSQSNPRDLVIATSKSSTFLSTGPYSLKTIRAVYLKLAGVSNSNMAHKQRSDSVVSLFRRIDENSSTKINAAELKSYLADIDLSDLQVADDGVELDAAVLSQQTVKLIDLNGNGVVTLEEWMGFVLDENRATSTSRGGGERYAVIERVRQAMHDAFEDEGSLLAWFRSIAGAIVIDKTSGLQEMKVRTRELKNALRIRFSFIDSQDLDEAVKLLDADSSGWITEKELRQWQFPTRDIEELTTQITNLWTTERQGAKLKDLSDDAFVAALYRRFDHDGNGLIARAEVREGFQSFRIVLNDEETALLIKEFDLDRDGFWNKSEFTQCVHKLVSTVHPQRVPDSHSHTNRQFGYYPDSEDSDHGYDTPDHGETQHQEDRESDDDSGYSLDELSPLAMSPVHFDEDAASRSKQQRATGVEYSDDFDEDA